LLLLGVKALTPRSLCSASKPDGIGRSPDLAKNYRGRIIIYNKLRQLTKLESCKAKILNL